MENPLDAAVEQMEKENHYSRFLLDPTRPKVPPKWLLRYKGIGFFPLGDIQAIKGRAGNGKSFLITIYITAILRREFLGFTCDIENARVLYIDTEQQEYNVRCIYDRIAYCVGYDATILSRFKILQLRSVSSIAERNRMVREALNEIKPTATFIDGSVDLLEDPNDFKESSGQVREFMATSSDIVASICNVIHVNPGSDKMRGHSGSEYERKASDVMGCEKVKPEGGGIPYFTVTHAKARNRDIEDFKFYIVQETEDGIPKALEGGVDVNSEVKRIERDRMFRTIMCDAMGNCKPWAAKSEIVRSVMGSEHITEEQAKKYFAEAKDIGIFNENGSRRYKYQGLPEKDVAQTTIFDDPADEDELPY